MHAFGCVAIRMCGACTKQMSSVLCCSCSRARAPLLGARISPWLRLWQTGRRSCVLSASRRGWRACRRSVAGVSARAGRNGCVRRLRMRNMEFIDDFESVSACQDKLWEVIQEEWRNMDPAKIYSISEHKYNIAKQVIDAKGKKITVERHGGARQKRDKDIRRARKK